MQTGKIVGGILLSNNGYNVWGNLLHGSHRRVSRPRAWEIAATECNPLRTRRGCIPNMACRRLPEPDCDSAILRSRVCLFELARSLDLRLQMNRFAVTARGWDGYEKKMKSWRIGAPNIDNFSTSDRNRLEENF